MREESLGDLEQLVLLAVLRLNEAYAVSVRDEIRTRSGREVTRGAVYVTLDRLQRKGYLTSEMGAPTPERGGKAKRVFRVEEAGIHVLRASLDGLAEMTRGLEGRLSLGWTTS